MSRKEYILDKLSQVIVECEYQDTTPEDMWEWIKEDKVVREGACLMCGFDEDDEDYILFSNGTDKYSVTQLFNDLRFLSTHDGLPKAEYIREARFMFNHLELWRVDDMEQEFVLDFEEVLCDALSAAKSKDWWNAYEFLHRACQFYGAFIELEKKHVELKYQYC